MQPAPEGHSGLDGHSGENKTDGIAEGEADLESRFWCCTPPPQDRISFFESTEPDEQLRFSSAFECGNLSAVRKIGPDHFELTLRFDDCYPSQAAAVAAPFDPVAGPKYPIPKVPPATAHWFYFAVRRQRASSDVVPRTVRFDIVNITRQQPRSWRSGSLAPAVWRRSVMTEEGAQDTTGGLDPERQQRYGWRRCTKKPSWARTSPELTHAVLQSHNAVAPPGGLWTLSLIHCFAAPSDESDSDVVFFAGGLPYTNAHLQNLVHWMEIQSLQSSSLTVEQCTLKWRVPPLPQPDDKSVARLTAQEMAELEAAAVAIAEENSKEHNTAVLTITGKQSFDDPREFVPARGIDLSRPHRPLLVLLARQRPNETCSSWALHGLLCFLCGSSQRAAALRAAYEVVCMPMVAAEGVQMGRSRSMHEESLEYEPDWTSPAYRPTNDEATSPSDALKRWLRGRVAEGRQVGCVIDVRAGASNRKGAVVSALSEGHAQLSPTSRAFSRANVRSTERNNFWASVRASLPGSFAEHTTDADAEWPLLTKTTRRGDSPALVIAREHHCLAFALEVPQFETAPGPCGQGFEQPQDVAYCGIRLAALGLAFGLSLHSCLCTESSSVPNSPTKKARPGAAMRRSSVPSFCADGKSNHPQRPKDPTAHDDDESLGPWTGTTPRLARGTDARARDTGSDFTSSTLLECGTDNGRPRSASWSPGMPERSHNSGWSAGWGGWRDDSNTSAKEEAVEPPPAVSCCLCFQSGRRGRCCSGRVLPFDADSDKHIISVCPWMTVPGRPGPSPPKAARPATADGSCSGSSLGGSSDSEKASSHEDSEDEAPSPAFEDAARANGRLDPTKAAIHEEILLDNTTGDSPRRAGRLQSPNPRRSLLVPPPGSASHSPAAGYRSPLSIDLAGGDSPSSDEGARARFGDVAGAGMFRVQHVGLSPAAGGRIRELLSKRIFAACSTADAPTFVVGKRGGPLGWHEAPAPFDGRKVLLGALKESCAYSSSDLQNISGNPMLPTNKVGMVVAPAPLGTVEFGSSKLPDATPSGNTLPVLAPLRPAPAMKPALLRSASHTLATAAPRTGLIVSGHQSSGPLVSRAGGRSVAASGVGQRGTSVPVAFANRQRQESLPELRRTPPTGAAGASNALPIALTPTRSFATSSKGFDSLKA